MSDEIPQETPPRGDSGPERDALWTPPSDRRELLRKVGKLAAYTGPVILVLFGAQKSAFGY